MRPLRLLAAAALLGGAALALPSSSAQALPPGMTVTTARHDVSRPLREIASASLPGPGRITSEARRITVASGAPQADPVLQSSATIAPRATVVHNYPGLGLGYPKFNPNAIPPDTVGAVGRTQYVQWVNSSFVVIDKKTGAPVLGPANGNTIWRDFGGECEKQNDGDPVVNYDRFANRWVLQQFAITNGNYECLAVSKTPDATGEYNRYEFKYKGFNDYPKAGVWSHSYLATYNMFDAESGTKVCAMERAAMLAGRTARQVCFQMPSSAPALLPADADGTRAPAANADAPLIGLGTGPEGTSALLLYSLHVDWKSPAKSKLSAPTPVTTAPYTIACGALYEIGSRITASCVPQPGPAAAGIGPLGLDALSDRPMFRLAWRKFADGHEAMVVTHSVDEMPVAAAPRWYELRRTGSSRWSVYQQGSYAPDLNSRWMGSAAMDKNGGIAVGYSLSGAATFPSIAIAGRKASDPKGQLSKETSIASGFGDQTTASYIARWGDYSAMTVDPVDDCTFWYTTEYMTQVGIFNWSTRIAAVKLPGC